MSTYLVEAVTQLHWWLALPPRNLIDRGDHVRFRYALYLIIHQIVTVLYSLNGHKGVMYFPSRIKGVRNILDNFANTPEQVGVRLQSLATEREQEKAWSIAAELIRSTLSIWNQVSKNYDLSSREHQIKEGVFKSNQTRNQAELYDWANELANRLKTLEGVEGVALGGSLGRGVADSQSDIDLLVFGLGMPSEKARKEFIAKWQSIEYGPIIESACDSVLIDGVMIHIRYWTTGTTEEMLLGCPAPPHNRILAEELQRCHILVDSNRKLSLWKQFMGKLSPDLIAGIYNSAQARLASFQNPWCESERAADKIHLYCLINQAVNDFLAALYIRNGYFLSTPRWCHREIPSFELVPEGLVNLPSIVDGIYDGEITKRRWQVLESLWEELSSLSSNY